MQNDCKATGGEPSLSEDEIKQLRGQIQELCKTIATLKGDLKSTNTKLKQTERIIEKYNAIREDLYQIAERLRAIEATDEEIIRQKKSNKANTSINQDWIMIGITLAMVGITLVNVFL